MADAFEPEIFGRFHLVDRIATGGMAEVFAARAHGAAGFAQWVAVKRIRSDLSNDPAFVELFVDEARTTAALDHPHVVRILEFDRADGHLFQVMELVRGRDLSRIADRARAVGERIPPAFVSWIGNQACHGLHYAHTRIDEDGRPLGIVHRDISPGNVLVGFDGQVKVADFGIARAHGSVGEQVPDAMVGKDAFMAPEHRSGEGADARSDVWALAATLYDALTGRRPWMEAPDDPVPAPGDLVPGVPPALDAVLLGALAPDPDRRPPTARALGVQLRDAGCDEARDDDLRDALASWLRDLFADEASEERARREIAAAESALAHDDAMASQSRAAVKTVRSARRAGVAGVSVVALLLLLGVTGWLASVDPPVPTVEVAARGALELAVTPAATLYLDGRPQGQGTTIRVDRLVPGPHPVRLEAEGHTPFEGSWVVTRGGLTHGRVALTPLPDVEPVRLRVTSRPGGADVRVDGRRIGTTPASTTLQAPDGVVRVVVDKAGFAPETRRLTGLEPGARRQISVTLSPAGAEAPAAAPGELVVRLIGATWAHVYVDGRKLASTAPLSGVPLSVGEHRIRVQNEAAGVDVTQTVRVVSGGTATVRARAR